MSKGKAAGLALFAAIVLLGVVWKFFLDGRSGQTPGKRVVLRGLVGSEKVGLLEDEAIQKILDRRFGLTLDFNKAGSLEMVQENSSYDFLFPSSTVAVEFYKARGRPLVRDAVLFNSPIVFYSWDLVVAALEKNGIVKNTGSIYYIVDLVKLVRLVTDHRKWADIGLPDLYGSVNIIATDPLKSNSGNQFAALLAGLLNQGEVVTEQSLPAVLPAVKDVFARTGYMEHSSGVLFEQYLRMGVGSHPLIVGYENQMVEFAVQNPETWENVRSRLRILYPLPTVWSSHTLMALTAKAAPLIKALEDPETQKLAWERHGFRTGIIGGKNDIRVLKVVGMPERIGKVLPMPSPAVMEILMQSLGVAPGASRTEK